MTIPEFIATHHLRTTIDRDADRWRCTIRGRDGRRRMILYFDYLPDAVNVLRDLALEARSVERDKTFYDWCKRQKRPTDQDALFEFKSRVRRAERLRNFLGWDAYDQLISTTD